MIKGLVQASCITAATAMGLAGCGGGDSVSATAATGNVTFALSDAAVDGVSAVNITVTGLELKPADGKVQTITFDQPKTLNLLDLQNGKTANLILNKPLPAGKYNWVRLMLDTSNLSLKVSATGGEESLTIPSGDETGLKLVHGFTVPSGGNVQFTLDFSVRKSLVKTGSGKYILKPTLRIVEDSSAGEIKGSVNATTVSSQCADASTYDGVVYLYTGDDAKEGDLGSSDDPYLTAPVTYDAQNSTYAYMLAHIPAGDYSIAYTCGVDNTSTDDNLSFVSGGNVTVTANQTSTVNIQ